ncbi:hypothetical protein Taro_028934 [Colocasia esculenta]|uniref:Uncharacterized protein n=1 Tax=Colocasia esculenta TaxID=4460 RepID=A0A843VTC5_COLES|nr:hypothetical protein [Colocasia esculenta]
MLQGSRQCFFRGQLGQTLLQHLGQGPAVVPRAFVSSSSSGRWDSFSNWGDSNSARKDHRLICFGGLLPRRWSLLPTSFSGRCCRGHRTALLGISKGHGGQDFSTSLRNIPPRKNCLASTGLRCRHRSESIDFSHSSPRVRGDRPVLDTELHALVRRATLLGASLIDTLTGQDPLGLVHRRLRPPSGAVRFVADYDQTQLGGHFRNCL